MKTKSVLMIKELILPFISRLKEKIDLKYSEVTAEILASYKSTTYLNTLNLQHKNHLQKALIFKETLLPSGINIKEFFRISILVVRDKVVIPHSRQGG
ncbi:hypothetical protein KAR34_14280 [bacterium]|nr:hypothetical protein [bacterium]